MGKDEKQDGSDSVQPCILRADLEEVSKTSRQQCILGTEKPLLPIMAHG
jgi:hypothetical protein